MKNKPDAMFCSSALTALKQELLLVKFKWVLLCLLIMAGTLTGPVVADDADGFVRFTKQMADSVGEGPDLIPVTLVWRYHPGDTMLWADPEFDDSDWELTQTILARDSMPEAGWHGIGWFRLRLVIDKSLKGVPIAYRLGQMGAAELFVDGRLIYGGGHVGRSAQDEDIYLQEYPDPMILVLEDTVALIAVRLSNHKLEHFHDQEMPGGFILELSDSNKRVANSTRFMFYVTAHQWGFTAACLVLVMVFALIYIFSHHNRHNLFFALLALGCAMMTYWPFEMHAGNSLGYYIFVDLMFKLGLVSSGLFGVRFLYELFYLEPPRQWWFFLMGGLLYMALGRILSLPIGYVYFIICMFEMVRVVTIAVIKRREGAVVIAIGFALFGIGTFYQTILELKFVEQPVEGIFMPYMAGILALLVAMSFHLARQFARTNAELIKQLEQVRTLSDKTIQQEVDSKLLQKDIEHKEEQLKEATRLEQALGDLEAAHSDLQRADERLRSIIDASPVPLIVTRICDGTIIYANKHLGRLVGYDVEELEGKLSPDFYYNPEDRIEVVKRLERDGLLDNHEIRIKHREGRIIYCLFSLVASRIGEEEVIIGGLYDISERKEAEEKLKLYRKIFDSSQDGIMVFDTNGRLILRNPAHQKLSGLSDKEVESESVLDLVPETARQSIKKGLVEGTTFRGEFEWPPVDGVATPIDLSVFTIPDAEGKVMYSVGMGRDVSEHRAAKEAIQKTMEQLQAANIELKQTQSQLVQSEKMASLGQLVAGVAHEINTPVGAVSSMHSTLMTATSRIVDDLRARSGGKIDEKLEKYIKAIKDADRVITSGNERVANIVKRLRSFARLDEADLKTVPLCEGIEDTLTLIHHEIKHGIEIIRDCEKMPPIACFPGQLNQVFLNILINARQAMAGKGKIYITARAEGDKQILEFTDSGNGIPAENLGRIFDPGFTTKGVGVGTGLGLSICYQIIADHHGRIEATSEVGKGTTFKITLPTDLEKRLAKIDQQSGPAGT